MRYFGAVLSKSGAIDESRLRLASETTWVARFQPEPKLAPEPIIWLSPSRRLALLSWGESANVGLYRGSLIIEEGPYALAGAGIYHDTAYRSDRELLSALATASDPDTIVARLGGSFALCLCDARNDRVRVWNSVCCHSNVLYRDTQDLFVVSTRGLFVSQVSEGTGAPGYDRTGFGRFVHSGFFPSDRSAYRDVQHLEGYQSLLASSSGVRARAIDDSFDGYGYGEEYPRPADFDEATQLLLNFFSAVGGDGVLVSSGLSGGKDSRLIAAAIKAAGISARIYCGDNWSDHPDLIIGQRVAKCLGIDAGNPRILDNDEPDPEILSVDVDEYFISQLRTWDAMRASIMRVPEAPNRRRSLAEKIRLIRDLSVSTDQPTNEVGLAGIGGELFRGGLAMRTHIGDAHFDEAFARRICEAHLMKGDNLLRETERKQYQAWFDDWFAANFSPARPLAVLERYYLQKQINRATAPVMGNSFSFFTDAKLLRLISRFELSVRQDELFHFELTRRLAPELEKMPLAVQRYGFEERGPRNGDIEGYKARTPIPLRAGTRAAHAIYLTASTDLRGFFEDSLLHRNRDVVEEVLDCEKLSRQLRSRAAYNDENSMPLWMAQAAILVLTDRWIDPACWAGGSTKAIKIRLDAPWNVLYGAVSDAADAALDKTRSLLETVGVRQPPRFPEALDALLDPTFLTSTSSRIERHPLPDLKKGLWSVYPKPLSCGGHPIDGAGSQDQSGKDHNYLFRVLVKPNKNTWIVLPIGQVDKMAGQRLSLTFAARTKPAAYNVLYIRTPANPSVKRNIFTSFPLRKRPTVKRQIFTSFPLRTSETWAEYNVDFHVPSHLSNGEIEVWFPVPTGVQPVEFGLALKALEGYTNSSDVIESARTTLRFGQTFSAELWRQLCLVADQYGVAESKLLEFAARFALDRPDASDELTTLRDALEQTPAWERYQLACLREEALLTGENRADNHCMLKPFQRARLALRRQLLIDDGESRSQYSFL